MAQTFTGESMKRIQFFFWFFFVQSMIVVGAQDVQFFEQGNKFFVAGRYQQACEAYNKIDNKGFAVWYNLALSYLHKHQQARAITCCKRAELQGNFAQLTQLYDLYDYMHRQQDPDFVPGWYEQLAIFMKKCILSFSMLLLQLLMLFGLCMLIICVHKKWYPKNNKVIAVLIFLYGMVVCAWFYKTVIVQQKIAVVMHDQATVYAGPDVSFYSKGQLQHADVAVVLDAQNGYHRVRTQQTVGWICDKDIELV